MNDLCITLLNCKYQIATTYFSFYSDFIELPLQGCWLMLYKNIRTCMNNKYKSCVSLNLNSETPPPTPRHLMTCSPHFPWSELQTFPLEDASKDRLKLLSDWKQKVNNKSEFNLFQEFHVKTEKSDSLEHDIVSLFKWHVTGNLIPHILLILTFYLI